MQLNMTDTTLARTLRRPVRKKAALPPGTGTTQETRTLDMSFLESLTGYNARRGALAVIGVFLDRMAPYGLRPVDFSVLTLIAHNPGATSRQICGALDILPPNLVGMLKSLEKRGLVEKREHPSDRRAQGLHLTAAGTQLQSQAQATARELEDDAAAALTAQERETLNQLLRKLYQHRRTAG